MAALRSTGAALAIAASVLASAPACHAKPSTAIGVAMATVLRPLRVVAVADMNFGTVTHAVGSGGTVTVSPGGAGAAFSGGASAVCTASDCLAAHAALFSVSGEPQRNYAIQLPASITATGVATNPGATAPPLVVNGLTLRTTSGAGQHRLDASGADRFEVGGTITLPADLPPARYRASFAVIVSYS
ncbi:DUF4402 domain-containing protein [Novosphingobium sp. Fuku2-ISO-50]|uniref:DUF4402 domain-containing protein n=1 Tax=Novosphingobium sp. Fuku2-ISO-50 TaxID=1739114 RepID=UPI00076CEED9|nr:DUF4402 domain-containing protein [Novosphingobium sp. Fuku2-ISO-50]KUR75056.1 hypothetical protein AQZ50_16710 [Novosphingobium sp. Fuku2-ISO-50]